MSIEIVTSPKSGVTLSLASHYLFAGHRFCLTFDAIQKDSVAWDALVNEVGRETLRSAISQRERRKRLSEELSAIQSGISQRWLSQRWRKPELKSSFKFEGARLTEVFKKSLIEKLDGLASRVQDFVGATPEKAETPEPAQ